MILSQPTNTLRLRMYISAPCPSCSSVLVPKRALCLLCTGFKNRFLKMHYTNVLRWRSSGHSYLIRVRKVRLISDYKTVFTLTLFLAIAKKWPKLREIFLYVTSGSGSGLVRLVPHAAVNEAKKFLLQQDISDLSQLRHLRIINIIITLYATSHDLAEWLQCTKGILSRYAPNSEDSQGPRKVVLYSAGRSPETHLVEVHKSQ